MTQGNDTALQQYVFQAWQKFCEEYKKNFEMQEKLQESQDRFSSLTGRKGSRENAMQRAAKAQDISIQLVIYMYWKKEALVQRMRRYGKEKNTKRKEQLQGVKGLFKNFANELDGSLKAGTPRLEPKRKGRAENLKGQRRETN